MIDDAFDRRDIGGWPARTGIPVAGGMGDESAGPLCALISVIQQARDQPQKQPFNRLLRSDLKGVERRRRDGASHRQTPVALELPDSASQRRTDDTVDRTLVVALGHEGDLHALYDRFEAFRPA